MVNNLSIIISSCDKYSDLWEANLFLLRKYWVGDLPPIYLVTDKYTDYHNNDVTVLTYDGDMPIRLKKACQEIQTQYVLITLDDYYLIDNVYTDNIKTIVDWEDSNTVDYLQLYHRRYDKKKYYTEIGVNSVIDLTKKYAISLYPAIWNKRFFVYCVDENETPWQFEPRLTQKAINYGAKCYINNSGSFKILDVIRKGKVLHKAHRYLRSNGLDIGNRMLVPIGEEIKLKVADCIWWYAPRWFYKLSRRCAEKLGMKFYSEE